MGRLSFLIALMSMAIGRWRGAMRCSIYWGIWLGGFSVGVRMMRVVGGAIGADFRCVRLLLMV